ncbi:ROK family protein [Nocardiopsis ansamitocini]|uniref:Kanosamine kinase n=1 Tax=Nocardiopsis ansamitocini TaxID=1670832 RepID=A0A9W6PB89_9ACTN|nr:ROK family protein [Nocardiopsis ansamitocini]GLU50346.1 kanosamine kinase [Nocardiopsis ansamitocini]
MSRLGIDIGGTKVALRLEGAGRAPWQTVFRWPEPGPDRGADPDADLAALAEAVRGLCAQWGGAVEGVGVASPATLDRYGRVSAWPGRPGWVGVDLRSALRALVPGVPVHCADDGDLAALAESYAAGRTDLLYLGVGTGVGGGIVIGGRSCLDTRRGSCEIGHLPIDRAGPRCDCGRRGCLQAVASGPATLRRASRLRGAHVDFAGLRDALAANRAWAVSAVRESCDALAAAVVGVGELLHPSLAVVGGGFATGLPGFVAAVSQRAAALGRPGHPPPQVREAKLGGFSSLHGAVHAAARPEAG